MSAKILQRAFSHAESGRFTGVAEIERQLKGEGVFVTGDLDGAALRRQLGQACDKARGKPVRFAAAPRTARVRKRTRPSLF